MIFVSVYRIIAFALQNFFRNAWLTAATISVLVLTLVSVNMLIVLNVLGSVALSSVQSKIDISIHFKPEIEESRIQTVKVSLLSLPEVKDVLFISPSQALTEFSEKYKEENSIIDSLGEVGTNPFGATLVIKARKLEGYQRIIEVLGNPFYANLIEGKNFEDPAAMIGRVESISRKLKLFGAAVSMFFGLITLLIVFNTIRVSIFTRKEEIGIMRLVGASNWFIRAPFYIEGIFWSIVAVFLCFMIVYPAIGIAQPFLQRFFGSDAVDMRSFYQLNFLKIFGSQLFAVSVMTFVTTKIATAKYLKV